jgi:hypothetical protein
MAVHAKNRSIYQCSDTHGVQVEATVIPVPLNSRAYPQQKQLLYYYNGNIQCYHPKGHDLHSYRRENRISYKLMTLGQTERTLREMQYVSVQI